MGMGMADVSYMSVSAGSKGERVVQTPENARVLVLFV